MEVRHPLALEIGIQYVNGGEARVIAELFKFLPSYGFDVVGAVAAPDDVAELTNGRILSFAPEDSSKIKRFMSARSVLIRILEESRPEVIASHFALYALPALDKLRRLPMVTHFHGPWGAESAQDGAGRLASAMRMKVEKTVYAQSQLVIVLSRAFAELAQSRYGIQGDRIRIVPGCVDIERFKPNMSRSQARELLGLPQDRPILLAVRRMVARMGLSELILALAEIKQMVPEVLLCIAGRGLLREVLEQLVRDLNLEHHVQFLGFVPDEKLPLLYRAADLNLVPTNALEGFGLVAAEALAAGTPSLVTRIGGLPEVVAGLSEDLIFESPHHHDLAVRIQSVLLGKLALPGSEACAAYAAAHFSSLRMAAETAAVYREVL
jgi:glycosyltransferase involved in cell wall biosynthesis